MTTAEDRALDDALVAAVTAEVRDYGVRRATASSTTRRASSSSAASQ